MNLNWQKNNIFLAVLLSLVSILLVGLIRPAGGDIDTGLSRDSFWFKKVNAPTDHSIVFAGDSRVMCGISPAAISTILPAKILNFGFNFVGYSDEYLTAVRAKLNDEGPNRAIVLGVTPRSLTPLNVKVSAYKRESSKQGYAAWKQQYMSEFFHFFRPVSLATTVQQIQGKRFYRNHYPDGYMSVELIPPNPNQDLDTYLKIFNNNTVDDQLIDGIITHSTSWIKEDIAVYAFRPPTTQAILDAELASGFDESDFERKFTSIGGVWLDFNIDDYVYADGSHINAPDVPQFSKDILAKMSLSIP